MTGPAAADEGLYAAIDLGANSFHLVIMRPHGNSLESVDTHRQIVRLSSGITPAGAGFGEPVSLRPEARRRALRCLGEFRARMDRHSLTAVRAVGTSTFRLLRHDNAFLAAAEETLGCPIDIVSGEEEARLIYLGATWGLAHRDRLVVDIGGGSTEVVLGHGADIATAVSLDIGSASLSGAFFSGSQIARSDIQRAREHVRRQLRNRIPEPLKLPLDSRAVGSSGTAKSLSWVLRSLHLTSGEITGPALQRIEPVLWQVDNMAQLSQVLNLNMRRAHVFPGGYVIMAELFDYLNLPAMTLSTRALREGIVVTLLMQPGGPFATDPAHDHPSSH